jgi:AcrR family transcriptional regulator
MKIRLKQEKFKQREEKIIRAALKLFVQNGIASVTIDMIAQQAKVGKGTIYNHFKSKNDIFAMLIIQQGQEMMDGLLSIDQAAPVLVKLKQTMRVIWEFQVRDVQKLAVFRKCDQLLMMDGLSPEVRTRLKHQNHQRNQFIRDLIQNAIEQEIFRVEALDNLTAVSVGLFRGVFDRILEKEVEPTEALYLLVERMIFQGFMR